MIFGLISWFDPVFMTGFRLDGANRRPGLFTTTLSGFLTLLIFAFPLAVRRLPCILSYKSKALE